MGIRSCPSQGWKRNLSFPLLVEKEKGVLPSLSGEAFSDAREGRSFPFPCRCLRYDCSFSLPLHRREQMPKSPHSQGKPEQMVPPFRRRSKRVVSPSFESMNLLFAQRMKLSLSAVRGQCFTSSRRWMALFRSPRKIGHPELGVASRPLPSQHSSLFGIRESPTILLRFQW